MNQAKNSKRASYGDRNNKTPRHSGPKVRVVDLRPAGSQKETLVELAVESLKRFYKTVDTLRLGNYKTGFNTYQYGFVVVEGFTIHRQEAGAIAKVTGTLFGLVKADEFIRLANSKAEPALADYDQAIFIEDDGGIFVDGNDTKVTVTKFRTEGPSTKQVVPFRNIDQFSGILIEQLFALDILPQFRKELSTVVAKQEAKHTGEAIEVKRDKPARRDARPAQGRPPRKTAEPLRAQA